MHCTGSATPGQHPTGLVDAVAKLEGSLTVDSDCDTPLVSLSPRFAELWGVVQNAIGMQGEFAASVAAKLQHECKILVDGDFSTPAVGEQSMTGRRRCTPLRENICS